MSKYYGHVIFEKVPEVVYQILVEKGLWYDRQARVPVLLEAVEDALENHEFPEFSQTEIKYAFGWLQRNRDKWDDGDLIESNQSIQRRASKLHKVYSTSLTLLEASYEGGICTSVLYRYNGQDFTTDFVSYSPVSY